MDLYKPFPLYVLNLLYDKINNIDKILLQKEYDFVPHKLKKAINKNVITDDNLAYFKNRLSIQLYNAIIYCLNQIGYQKEILDQDMIIDDIINTLKINNVIFKENEFRKQNNNIIFCILLLLHLKTLVIEENNDEEIPYCSILFDAIENKGEKSCLGLYGIMNSPEGDDIKIAFPLLSTKLLLSEYCDDNLLNDILHSDRNDEITRPLRFNDFKLSYTIKSRRKLKNAIIFIIRTMKNGKLRAQILSLKDSTKHKVS